MLGSSGQCQQLELNVGSKPKHRREPSPLGLESVGWDPGFTEFWGLWKAGRGWS